MNLDRWEEMVLNRFWRSFWSRIFLGGVTCLLSVAAAVSLDCLDCNQAVADFNPDASIASTANAQETNQALCSGSESPGKCESLHRILLGQKPLPSTQALSAVAVGVILVWLLCWTLVACVARHKNRHVRNAGFWFSLSKAKRKVALLLLVISYLPVSRVLIDNVRPIDAFPNASTAVAKWGFPAAGCAISNGVASRTCPNYPSSFDWFLQPPHVMFLVS